MPKASKCALCCRNLCKFLNLDYLQLKILLAVICDISRAFLFLNSLPIISIGTSLLSTDENLAIIYKFSHMLYAAALVTEQ